MEEVRRALGDQEPHLKNDRHSPDQVWPPAQIWCIGWLCHFELVLISVSSVIRITASSKQRAPTHVLTSNHDSAVFGIATLGSTSQHAVFDEADEPGAKMDFQKGRVGIEVGRESR